MLLGGQTRQAQLGCMHALSSPGPQQRLCINPSYHGAGPQHEAVGAGLAFQHGKRLVSLHSMPLCAGNITIGGESMWQVLRYCYRCWAAMHFHFRDLIEYMKG